MYNKEREVIESRREFGYFLMRGGRSLSHIFYWLGIMILIPGLLIGLTNLPSLLQYTLSFGKEIPEYGEFLFLTPYGVGIMGHAMLGLIAIVVGFFFVSVGYGATEPYKLTTAMPSTYVRTCRKCGEALPKDRNLIHLCPRCHAPMPSGFRTYVARFGNVVVTYINYIILLTAAALVFAK